MVKEGQDVGSAAPQGAAALGDLLQSGWHATADRGDQPGHGILAAASVRIGVGGDDLLIDQPGDLDRGVFVGIENDASPPSGPARIGPKPMGRLSDSTAPSQTVGPMPGSTSQLNSATPPYRAGCISTITTEPTPPSEAAHRSPD